VVGVDIGNPMFMAMCEALEVLCLASPIERRRPLPAELTGFDVITAISPKFYKHEKQAGRAQKSVWDDDDWDFFVADLASRLSAGGIFLGKFNPNHQLPPRMWRRVMNGRGLGGEGISFVLSREELAR
jgi:hypothetical protein